MLRDRAVAVAVVFIVCAACGDDLLTLPLAAEAGDVAVLAYRKDGRPQIALRPFQPGAPFEVDADQDQPVYSFIVRPQTFVDAEGAPLRPEQLAQVRLRRDTDVPGPSSCARCLVGSVVPPQPVQAGAACAVPAFATSAVWRPRGDGTADCAAGPDGRQCAPGGLADFEALEQVRRQLILEWPGECACRPRDARALASLAFRAIAPVESPWPIDAWARGADGRIAGFRREAALHFDPAGEPAVASPLTGLDAHVRGAAGLRDGGFLVAGDALDRTLSDPYVFFRVRPQGDGFAPAERLLETIPVRSRDIRYLEADGPLYLFGSIQQSLSLGPSIVACNDNFSCVATPVGTCPRDPRTIEPDEGRILANGVALARAPGALYVRPSGAGPQGTWTCRQPTSYAWLDPNRTDPLPRVRSFWRLGVSGSRAFVCASTEPQACESSPSVVLTAEIDVDPAAPTRPPDPDWRIAYVTAPGQGCSSVLERGSAGVRVVLSGFRTVDFDGAGRVIGEGTIDALHGPWPQRAALHDVGGGVTVHVGQGHRVAVHDGQSLRAMYGRVDPPADAFRAGVALPDGRFALFGAQAVVFIDRGVLQRRPAEGDVFAVASAALDPASPTEGPWRVMTASEDGRLAEVTLTDDGTNFRALATPNIPAGAIRGLAAIGPGRFIVAGPGTAVFRVGAQGAAPITVTWDDPTTEPVEAAPVGGQNFCTGQPVPPDPFRAVAGGDGVAWIVGRDGLALRVVGDRAERFALPPAFDAAAVEAACPDVPRIVGQTVQTQDGFTRVQPQAFVLVADPEVPRGHRLISIGEDQVLAARSPSIRNGRPIAILRDGLWSSSDASGFAFVMSSSAVHRMFSDQPARFIRGPFDPQLVLQAADGAVLFGAPHGRVAIGRPAGP